MPEPKCGEGRGRGGGGGCGVSANEYSCAQYVAQINVGDLTPYLTCGLQSRQSAKLFLQSSELGLLQPLTPRRMYPPPFGSGGRVALAGERGGGRVPIPTRGHTLRYSVYICTLCCGPLAALAVLYCTILSYVITADRQIFGELNSE